MVDHRMNVSITNNAQFPLAEIALDASESVRIQTGSMIYHTPNVVLNAKVNAESQSIFGKAIQAVGRSMASGEGVFITEATAQSNNGRLALAPNVPGQIVALEQQYRLNDGAFLAMDGSASYTLETQSVGRALFGGQGGFYVMSTQGQGTLLVNSFGSIQKVELHNDRITIDNAHVVAWSRELEYDIHLENGFWQSMGTGEGVVNTFYGTGEIYIQSLNIETFANVLRPHLHIDNS
ncbi:TIGR00266 family protein [Streptococcus sanguinis]|uniref:TIGR00266 family protein n=1 Tax=Streptococcus sanguinis TaxID=1305 RepID=UPI001D14C9C5|nr:TIGR00266 family protein [Streptococcus sanguinis]MCC3173774.1 mitochondrial biogenesis AIM24 family protein [Streptococcus sanguinis]